MEMLLNMIYFSNELFQLYAYDSLRQGNCLTGCYHNALLVYTTAI